MKYNTVGYWCTVVFKSINTFVFFFFRCQRAILNMILQIHLRRTKNLKQANR